MVYASNMNMVNSGSFSTVLNALLSANGLPEFSLGSVPLPNFAFPSASSNADLVVETQVDDEHPSEDLSGIVMSYEDAQPAGPSNTESTESSTSRFKNSRNPVNVYAGPSVSVMSSPVNANFNDLSQGLSQPSGSSSHQVSVTSAATTKKIGNSVEFKVNDGSLMTVNRCVIFVKKGTKAVTCANFKNLSDAGSVFVEHHCASIGRFVQKACFNAKSNEKIPCKIVELSKGVFVSKVEQSSLPLKLTRSVAASVTPIAK
jgi:hypothetical protein